MTNKALKHALTNYQPSHEGISKAANLGNLLRSAHAFGASFVFTIGADEKAVEMHHDTSKAWAHLPLYHWRSLADLKLPERLQPGGGGDP